MNNIRYKVSKFGGTSLASAKSIDQVASIIEQDDLRRHIVVSAPGKRFRDDVKVTDLLVEVCKNKNSGVSIDEPFSKIIKRFLDIEEELGLDSEIESSLIKLYEQIKNDKNINNDIIESAGEYFMARLMSKYTGFEFVDILKTGAISFNETGIVDLEQCLKGFNPYAGKRTITPGFYGRTPDGKIKTLGRGGSDITGAIIANIVDAEVYENFTDVNGIYNGDPNKISGVEKYGSMTYDEFLTLKNANVLHSDCISFLRPKDIPVNVRSTFEPDEPGTMIVSNKFESLEQL